MKGYFLKLMRKEHQWGKLNRINEKQSNRGDMRKIHVTRQFFEASGRHRDFYEKKNVF